jgi:aspartyl-tRNA(Asn)/glutamyl-tRNA(Gln) amidotransferase subunit A
MVDVDALTLAGARDLLAARAISSTELLSAVLARLEATEPVIHAYAHVFADAALHDAARADRATGEPGPLHGIPFAAKDVFWTANQPSEAGSALLAGFRPTEDAQAVAALRRAGAVLVGKHVTHEFAVDPELTAARNAWQPEHYSGGSSAGSGASVAVGSSLAALATDAGGSVRKPAALNGVTGLKPTAGVISRHGVIRPSGPLDTVGVLARTTEDCALLFGVLVPGEPCQPRPSLAGVRLGVSGAFFGDELDPEARTLVEAAIAQLRELGAQPVEIRTPSVTGAVSAALTIVGADSAAAHADLLRERPGEYRPGTLRALLDGQRIPAAQLAAAQETQRALGAELRAAFAAHRLDALVAPTLPKPSIPAAEAVGGYLEDYVRYTVVANLTGRPALSVPCGFTGAGLPIGLQLIGEPQGEPTLFDIGHAYQRVTGWHRRRPAIRRLVETAR